MLSGHGIRKTKPPLELTVARDITGTKMSWCCFINSRRINKENVGPLLNGAENLVRVDADRSELLNVFFASLSASRASQAFVPRGRTQGKKQHPLVDEDQVRGYLSEFSPEEPVGPEGLHPRMLREQAKVTVRSLCIIFERSWRS